jgi:RHS repeat-associated protein
MTEVVNSYGHATRYQRRTTGQIELEIDPNGSRKETRYDEHGRIALRIDPMGGETEYKYDERGNRSEIIKPDGSVTKYSFNENHQLIRLEDAAGNTWTRTYDESNRLVALTNPLGETWLREYDQRGCLIASKDPEGRAKRYAYSGNGDLSGMRDREGHDYKFSADAFGRITMRLDPVGRRSTCEYDILGRPVRLTYPDGRDIRLAYGATRKPVSIDYGKGRLYRFKYGTCGRLLEETDPLGNTLRYGWGTEPGHMLSIRNPRDEIHEFEYDPAGRLIGERDFSGRRLRYRYDRAGNCICKTNGAGEKVELKRDLLGRVIAQASAEGEISEFTYDHQGFIIRASNGHSDLKFERDPLGRVTREIQGDAVIESSYDKSGNRIRLSASFGLLVLSQFDGNGYQTAISVGEEARILRRRNPLGQETNRKLPGGVDLFQDFDAYGNLERQTLISASTPIRKREFAYSENLLASLNEQDGRSTGYRYDLAERLSGVKQANLPATEYRYDANGNVSAVLTGGEEVRVGYGPGDALETMGGWEYRYDANGRLIEKHGRTGGPAAMRWSFEWDSLDRLVRSTNPEGQVWEYTYDAFGRRLGKHCGGRRITYAWDRNSPIRETDGEKSSQWIFNPSGLTPIATIQNGRFYSIACDHLGTPRELISDAGKVEWSVDLDAWGGTLALNRDSADCPLRFPGQWYDEETGLHYNRFRYYDPGTFRYISPDPLGISAGPHAYNYTRNPVNIFDPLGLCPDEDGPEREPYVMGPHDEDWRGSGRGHREAIDEAFSRTGQPREEFEITRWGRDEHGKSFPAEWRHPSGAEVNVDAAHLRNGPDVPHVGWQTGGKRNSGGGARGHILLDDVPYNR